MCHPDLEWKIIYVGSASSEAHDQTLDSVLVGPVPAGRHRFVFQANAPDTAKIPSDDAVGVTVVLLTCSYKGHEFVRVGYYVNNEYTDAEMTENPPAKVIFDKVSQTPITMWLEDLHIVRRHYVCQRDAVNTVLDIEFN